MDISDWKSWVILLFIVVVVTWAEHKIATSKPPMEGEDETNGQV